MEKKCSVCPLVAAMIESIRLKSILIKKKKIKTTAMLFEQKNYNLN